MNLENAEIDFLEKVQFNLVNTTATPVNVNVFDLTLSDVDVSPTLGAPNTLVENLSVPSARYTEINPTTGYLYCTDNSSNVYVYDTNTTNLITTIDVGAGTNPTDIVYDPVNNRMYVVLSNTSNVAVINCTNNTVLTTINTGSPTNLRHIAYNSVQQEVYITFSTGYTVVSTVTNLGLVTNLSGVDNRSITFDSTNNRMYMSLGLLNRVLAIDCVTASPIATIIVGTTPTGICYLNDSAEIFVLNSTPSTISVISTATNSVTNTFAVGIGRLVDCALDTDMNLLYVTDSAGTVGVIDVATQTVTTTFSIYAGINILFGITYVSSNDSMYMSYGGNNVVSRITTIGVPTNSFYISGSTDYNCFVRNIENEPILIKGIWFIPNNQQQLANPVVIKQKDADGHEYQYPELPIVDVSTYQEQGNRAFVDLSKKPVVFDGRKFFSQYHINANETVTLVILYDQFNRSNFDLKNHWLKKPLFYGIIGDEPDIDMTHNEIRYKYDENY